MLFPGLPLTSCMTLGQSLYSLCIYFPFPPSYLVYLDCDFFVADTVSFHMYAHHLAQWGPNLNWCL